MPLPISFYLYKEDHYTLLHTKYGSSVLSEKKVFFYVFPMMPPPPQAGPVWTPGAWLAGFIKRTTIHCYTQNMKALGFVVSEKKTFLCFSHCKSMGANDPQNRAIFDPRSMVGRNYKEDHYKLLHTKHESSGPCGFGEEDFFLCFSHCKSMGAMEVAMETRVPILPDPKPNATFPPSPMML